MSSQHTASPSAVRSLPRMLTPIAWASFISNVLIIATGGAVRLTGSGLGCPTWPMCTPGSLVPTDELSYHSLIEFGNRLMTGLLGILAVLVVLLVWKSRHRRKDLWALSLWVLVGIVAQAGVGGITVLTGLNPFIVGFHYIVTIALVCATAAFIWLMPREGTRVSLVPGWVFPLLHSTSVVLAITLIMGVITTGNGPHSGDIAVLRKGVNVEVLEHFHAWPAYLLLGLVVTLLYVTQKFDRTATFNWLIVLLVLIAVQVLVGLYQARNGLPPLSVGVHMVLAGLVSAAMTMVVMSVKDVVHHDVVGQEN